MRRLTKKEKEWKTDFENGWERDDNNRPEKRKDIMSKGVRYGRDFEEPISIRGMDECDRSSLVDKYVGGLLRGGVNVHGDYSPLDYYALPEQWFTHKWTDAVDRLVDKKRGRAELEDSGVAGIIKKGGFWEVNRFFEGVSTMLGRFIDLEDAKSTLRDYNKKITKSGYGVEY
jgi:hypothetical protein